MPPLDFDPKISIEGIFTAVGVLVALFGGVAGFLIGFFRRFRSERKERRERADRLTIMEILEIDLLNGLDESKIKDLFRSEGSAVFRRRAGATNPRKLTDHDFSRYLRDLQWSHMVDQVEKDRYRLRSEMLSYEEKKARQHEFVTALSGIVSEEKVISVLEKHFDKISKYERTDALKSLVASGRSDIVKRLSANLDSENPEEAIDAALTFLEAMKKY